MEPAMPNEAAQKLMNDMNTVLADAEELVNATAGVAGEKVAAARDRLRQAAAEMRPRLARAQALVGEKARSAAYAADGYVHERPWTAIGVAACVGALIGMLVGRR
ncbi:MAG: DUF883 family protein [Proteobacteria bacterium]|nr:DUF883 family protein [Pseudomonadota bacterium]